MESVMTDERSEEVQSEPPAPEQAESETPAETEATETEVVEVEVAETEVAEVEQPVDSSTEAPHELTLGSGPPAAIDEAAQPHAKPVIRGKVDQFGVAMGTGRRKTAVARVRIKDGNGDFTINGRPVEDYFRTERDRKLVEAPLRAAEEQGNVDVWVRVNGGGTTGQAGAIVLGVARALQVRDPGLHQALSAGGYLTRDDRMVERKKYGFRKARRSFQFSKR
jgi:small subunit ribosomal protein S9